MLAQGLRGETVAPEQVSSQALLLLGQPDQEMLRSDVAVAELPRGGERSQQRRFHPRRDADLAALGALALFGRGHLVDLCLEVLGRDLQPRENRLDHVVVGQRVEDVLGVDLPAAPLDRDACRLLQDLLRLRAEDLADVGRLAVAPGPSGLPRSTPAGRAPESVVEKVPEHVVPEQAAAEQRLERRGLLRPKLCIVLAAYLQPPPPAVLDDRHPERRRTAVANVAQLSLGLV